MGLHVDEVGSLAWIPSRNIGATLRRGGASLTHRPDGMNEYVEKRVPIGRTRGGIPGLHLGNIQKGPSTANRPPEDLVPWFTTLVRDIVPTPQGIFRQSSQAVIA